MHIRDILSDWAEQLLKRETPLQWADRLAYRGRAELEGPVGRRMRLEREADREAVREMQSLRVTHHPSNPVVPIGTTGLLGS